MNDFTASNGIKIRVADGPSGTYLLGLMPTLDQTHATGSVEGIQALREFFQAEADERLGRWRWPENPDYVVYHWSQPQSSGVVVMSETEAVPSRVLYVGCDPDNPTPEYRAACAYFDAHPEPKPWHDASIGDVWVMEPLEVVYTVVGGDEKWFTRGDVFGKAERRDLNDPVFTSGRRIWPGVS